MLPPLWPWKLIMLPARGPQPSLKSESTITMRLMDDVQIPGATSNGAGWHSFGGPQNDSFYRNSFNDSRQNGARPQLAVRQVNPAGEPQADDASPITQVSYVPQGVRTGVSGTAPGVPVFVLKSGMVLEVGNYTYQDNRISYELAAGGTGVIAADEVDWTTTTRVNQQRGVRVSLRGGHPAPGVTGY